MRQLMRSLFMLAFIPALAFAGVVEVQVTGTGLNQESAIESGLLQALRQVHGIDIQSIQQSSQLQIKEDGKSNTEISVNRNSQISAKGQIASYNVLDSDCSEDSCTVQLNVQVHKYQAPGLPNDNRRKIAVLPFTGETAIRSMVTHEVQEQLIQSRRFAVLDREHKKEYDAEKKLWQSGDVSIAERARMGQVLGLDYILTGRIEKAGIRRWNTGTSLTGENQSHVRTYVTVRYQIIAIATRQIKWSDTVSVALDNISSLEQAAALAGQKISTRLLSNIYPIRVVQLSDNQVLLNQGGKTIQNGSYFDIYSLGDIIYDPYTNEALGQSETKIATVQVVRVGAKLTYTKTITGRLKDIKPGFIARLSPDITPDDKEPTILLPKNDSVTIPSQKKDNVTVPSAGGVIL